MLLDMKLKKGNHRILNPARLPIPPHPRDLIIVAQISLFVKHESQPADEFPIHRQVVLSNLSFLAEIRQTKRSRRLVLTLFAHADQNQHDDGDHVREHLNDLSLR